MGYYNPIYIYGVDKFLTDAKSAGVDGLIIVDLPPEEDAELCLPAMKAGLNFIRLATPTTDDKRLPAVLANTSGFVYYVSITGITGSASADSEWSARPSPASSGIPNAGLCRLRHPHPGSRPRHRAKMPMARWSVPRWSMPCAAASIRRPRDRQDVECGGRSCGLAGAGRAGSQTGRGISHNCGGTDRRRRLAGHFGTAIY